MDESERTEAASLGPFTTLWVVAVVLLNWLVYVLPTLAAGTATFEVPVVTTTGLALVSVDPRPSTLIVAGGVAGLATLGAVAMALGWVLGGKGPSASTTLKILSLILAPGLLLPAEWCGGDLVPDVFSVTSTLVSAALVGIMTPLLALWASVALARRLLTSSARSPFFAGIVAGVGSLLLVPPAAAAGSLLLVVSAVNAAVEAPPPPDPAPRAPTPLPDLSGLGFGAVGAPAPTAVDLDECLRQLFAMRTEVERNLQSRYRLGAADAQDVTSESMVSVCLSENLSTYENLGGVFQKSANNRAVDLLRRRRGEAGEEALWCLPHFPDDWRLVSEIRVAEQAFGTLDGRTQDALRLWSQDESHAEIANRLGVTERQSRDLVGNGLKSMRRQVESACLYSK